MSILLIPSSFQFVDALCITIVLGYLCQTTDTVAAWLGARRRRRGRGGNSKRVVVSIWAEDKHALDDRDDAGEATGTSTTLPCDTTTSTSTSRKSLRRSSNPSAASRRQSSHRITPQEQQPVSPPRNRGASGGNAVVAGTTAERKSSSLQGASASPIVVANDPRSPPFPSSGAVSSLSPSTFRVSRRDHPCGSGPPTGEKREKKKKKEKKKNDARPLSGAGSPAAMHWCLALVAACELALAAIDDALRSDK